MNIDSFYDAIIELAETEEDRDLSPFLLALYPMLLKSAKKAPSFELFLELIKKALRNKPVTFDPSWSGIMASPIATGLSRKLTHPDLNFEKNISSATEHSINFTLDVVRFQAAEMERMANKQLVNEMRYFGVISDSGHDWYNFTALSVLECGIACSQDNQDDPFRVNWGTLGQILEDGRIYE